MNARFGIVFPAGRRQSLLSSVPRATRMWGDEIVEVGDEVYAFAALPGVEFKVYRLRGFIQTRVPVELQGSDTEYVSMQGAAVDAYEEWMRGGDRDVEAVHPFEAGLISLIEGAGLCAVMLVPDNDSLEDFVTTQPASLIKLLRENVQDLSCARGFLATIPAMV